MTKETLKDKKVGKAYAFFYCSAPKADIDKVLPKARDIYTALPNNLELTLTEGINPEDFRQDPQLRELAEQAREEDCNYSITAALPY